MFIEFAESVLHIESVRRLYRVRRRERHAGGGRLGAHRVRSEDALDGGLRVVEVSGHGERPGAGAVARDHLQALYARRSGGRIEHGHGCALAPGEARHRGGAGVAARGREHQHALRAGLRGGVRQQDGEHRERDVLERARRPVEQLQEAHCAGAGQRHGVAGREARKQPVHGGVAHGLRNVAEERRERGVLGLAQVRGHGDAGNVAAGDVQAPVGGEPPQYRFGGRRLYPGARACEHRGWSFRCFSRRESLRREA